MSENEKSNRNKLTYKASVADRISAFFVLLAVLGVFAGFYMVKIGRLDPNRSVGGCAFKSTYGIPCPLCGMTGAIRSFMDGEIIEAFYIQPGITVLAVLMAGIAFFSLLTASLGLNFFFLPPLRLWRGGYILLILIIIFAVAWMVTLARAIAENWT